MGRRLTTHWSVSAVGPVLGGGALAVGLGWAAEQLGIDVPLPAGALCGAALGLVASPPVRLALERRSSGPLGALSLVASAVAFGGMLTVLGLGLVVPAALTSASVYAVLLQPTRSRLLLGVAVSVAGSGAAVGAQAAGWVDGVVSTPTAAMVAAALLLLTTPTVANVADVGRRAQRAAAELEVERSLHLADVERAALRDPLTGLLGRRGLAAPLERAVASAAPGALTAVLFVDLDGFKPVNDRHGHAAGDQLLTVVAARLQRCARGEDAVARTGGDEFVLVLRELPDTAAAEEVAVRVRTEVAREVRLASGALVSVGASTGVATTVLPCDPEALLSAADAAMYAAKRSGARARARLEEG